MRNLSVGAAVLLLSVGGAAHGEVVHYAAGLNGASEVPPQASPGGGTLSAALDTRTRRLDFKLDFHGLSGPATGAHIHGPAGPGANAPPSVMIGMGSLPNPVRGSQALTAVQVAQLRAGRMYVNVHTPRHPDGEVRGQLLRARR